MAHVRGILHLPVSVDVWMCHPTLVSNRAVSQNDNGRADSLVRTDNAGRLAERRIMNKIPRTKRPWWQSLVGRVRLFWGFCPECNSSAPEMYSCPTCKNYHSATGDPFPPTDDTKVKWWARFHESVCQHGNIMSDPCPECREMFRIFGSNPRNPRRG